jgi:hypothetical protein
MWPYACYVHSLAYFLDVFLHLSMVYKRKMLRRPVIAVCLALL